jgi:predicted O-linked N-acetylglucosamine transferase (SPINDLY family)
LPALHNGYVTFGAFNNYAKLSPSILSLWAQILHKVPHSKLLVKATSLDDAATRQLLVERFAKLGISSERLILTGYALAMTDHLGMYSQVDLALDSFPYNGATTTCESLWMGVPVVTLVGETHVSRMGLSILSTLGLTELIAQTEEEYINICINLAYDLSYLQQLRETMRARMESSALMEAASFTRQLEAIYRKIWDERIRN